MDIFYSDSLSRYLAFHCFMFMPEMSNRMVFVNGKHPRCPVSRIFIRFLVARFSNRACMQFLIELQSLE